MNKAIYIRDDDVYTLDEKFLEFHNALINNGFPVVYAVIPGRLDKPLVEFLRMEIKKYPGMISVAQHGWMHENYAEKSPKFEFGYSRTAEQQRFDIKSGFNVMKKEFGSNFTRVFVPPYHAFSQKTLEILKQEGFLGISTRSNLDFIGEKNGFMDIPVNLAMNLYSDEGALLRPTRDMLKMFLALYRLKRIIGICIHHSALNKDGLERFVNFLLFVRKRYKGLAFVNFNDFALLNKAYEKRKDKPNVKHICLELTNQCNLRCNMCSIWQDNENHELSLDTINKLFDLEMIKNACSVSLTGGEIFLHPEIKEIYDYLKLLKDKGRITEIVLNSNGFATKRITDFFKNVDEGSNGLEIYFSMDGSRKTHDTQRGMKGAYDALIQTIGLLKRKGINVKIKMTLTGYNYGEVMSVYDYCKKNRTGFYVKLAEDKAENYYQRFRGFEKGHDFMLGNEHKGKLIADLNRIAYMELNKENSIIQGKYLALLIDSLKNKRVAYSCMTPKHYLFVSSKGDIFPCLYEKPIASLNGNLNIDFQSYNKIIEKGITGKCRQCMAYHGFMKQWNIKRGDLFSVCI